MNATEDWWESTVLEYQDQAGTTRLEEAAAAENTGTPQTALLANFTDDLLRNLTWARELGVPRIWLLTHAAISVPPELHLLVALILTTIGVLGTAGNAIVVWVFTR